MSNLLIRLLTIFLHRISSTAGSTLASQAARRQSPRRHRTRTMHGISMVRVSSSCQTTQSSRKLSLALAHLPSFWCSLPTTSSLDMTSSRGSSSTESQPLSYLFVSVLACYPSTSLLSSVTDSSICSRISPGKWNVGNGLRRLTRHTHPRWAMTRTVRHTRHLHPSPSRAKGDSRTWLLISGHLSRSTWRILLLPWARKAYCSAPLTSRRKCPPNPLPFLVSNVSIPRFVLSTLLANMGPPGRRQLQMSVPRSLWPIESRGHESSMPLHPSITILHLKIRTQVLLYHPWDIPSWQTLCHWMNCKDEKS